MKFSISLENFKILKFFNLWTLMEKKNKGLRRFHIAEQKKAENADTKTRKMRLPGFSVIGFR